MTLLIYQDYVHNNGALWSALVDLFGSQHIRYVDARDIINGVLTKSTKAFFIPGGASRYVADKLNGTGNRLIKEYVNNGGLYIGICSGAYYACRRTEWRQGEETGICVDNELAFFDGMAKGPIPAFDNGTEIPACITTLEVDNGQQHSCLYWGGPLFYGENTNSYQVLGRYTELPSAPAAIVSGRYGKGNYVLFSPHLEIGHNQLELMQFNVVANEHEALNGLSGKTLDRAYFHAILSQFISP